MRVNRALTAAVLAIGLTGCFVRESAAGEVGLTEQEHAFFSMFAMRVRIDDKLVRKQADFRKLPELIAASDGLLRTSLEAVYKAMIKSGMTEAELRRYAYLQSIAYSYNDPGPPDVEPFRQRFSNSLLGAGLGLISMNDYMSSMTNNIRGYIDQASGPRLVVNRSALREIEAIERRVIERTWEANKVVLRELDGIVEAVAGRLPERTDSDAGPSLGIVKGEIYIEVQVKEHEIVDPIVQVSITRHSARRVGKKLLERAAPEDSGNGAAPPKLNGVFPLPNLPPGSKARVYLGLPARSFNALDQVDVMILSVGGRILVKDVPGLSRKHIRVRQ